MDRIDNILTKADRAWRGYGVSAADRKAFAAELRLDLRAAAADGRDPDEMLGGDVTGFARRLADESGVAQARAGYLRLLGTALVGAVLGGALGFGVLAVLYRVLVHLIDLPRSIEIPVWVAVPVYYSVPAAAMVAGAAVLVRIRLGDLPRIRHTAWLMSLLMPLAGIVVTPLTILFAQSTDYSTAPSVLATEVAIVLAALAGATVLARHLSLRNPGDRIG